MKASKQSCLRIPGALLLLAVLAWVSAAFESMALSDPEEGSEFNLAAMMPLTGDFAPFGNHVRRGVELAAEHLMESGVRVRVSYENACLPAETVAAMQKLTSQHRIDALVANYCVIGIYPVLGLLESKNISAFQTSEMPKALLKEDGFLFSTSPRIKDESVLLAEYAKTRLFAKSAAILYLSTQWGEEFQNTFAEEFQKRGGLITGSEASPIGQNDFKAELLRLKRGKPDVVFVVHLGPTLGIIAKQIRDLGMSQQLLTTSEGEEASVLETARGAAEGLRFFSPAEGRGSAETERFEAAFKVKFGSPAHPLSRHSYDSTMLIGTALKSCNRDQTCVRKKLREIRDHKGASGLISMNRDGSTSRPFFLKRVEGNEFRTNEE